ncbi:hypothetical protein QC762_501500 [Podospora pseudocomata]|uniref:Adhesin domain-containing protein n=1 Tax=Podospora pseudocomata TaxID=2093779 RepID=A0ABR0GA65_9PEZI|nr:hypothetical protein QC762_501500 [Podospora pseudocomata]
MLILLCPTRRLPAVTVVASRLKLANARPQRRWLNLWLHSKDKWKTLPWDQTVYLRLLKEHEEAVKAKRDDVAWGLPSRPYIYKRGIVVHALNLKHYVILLDRVSLSVRLDDPQQEPVLTVDVFMLTSTGALNAKNNHFSIRWSDLDREPMLGDQDPWQLTPSIEYEFRPEENPNLPITKVARMFQKEVSRPVLAPGALTIPVKHLSTPLPHRWFALTRESIDRLDPTGDHGPSTREFLAFCPALGEPAVGRADAYYHGHQKIYLPPGRWPFEDRTAVVFSQIENTEDEKRRMAAAAQRLAQKFKEMGRVRSTTVKQLWLAEIIKKAWPPKDYSKFLPQKAENHCRVLIARALEKWRGTTIVIHVSTELPQKPTRLLLEEVSANMKQDTVVIVSLMGRRLYDRIFNHRDEKVRETFATEIVFKPPLRPAPVVEEPVPETTAQEDEMLKRLMEKFLSQNEQRKMREREEAEKARREEERQRKLAEARKKEEEERQARIRHERKMEKEAEERRRAAERERLKIQKDVESMFEAAVQYEIDASLRKEESVGERVLVDDAEHASADDAENETEEAQLSEGSINIKNGAICIETEGSIDVMGGFLNKRDGSIMIKTGFVNMVSGDIDFLHRDDRKRFQEDLGTVSISFEDGVSRRGINIDDADSNPDLISLTDAKIKITEGYIEINDGSIKVTGEEGLAHAKKILSSIRIKRGAIHIIEGSATFTDGQDDFINCSFDIKETTLGFKDGYTDIEAHKDMYSTRDWGRGYQPNVDGNSDSTKSWSYDLPQDKARERVRKMQDDIEEKAREQWAAEEKKREREEQQRKRKLEEEEEERKRKLEEEEQERIRKEILARKRESLRKSLSTTFVTDSRRKKKD